MKCLTRMIFLDDDGEKFFGEGPCRLLHAVEETGSLRAAAFSMGMAYTKALKLINTAETSLGYPLTTRSTGGKSGGGTALTPQGKAWLMQYEAYRDACVQANRKLYKEYFQNSSYDRIGCVILASGLGTRFGGNKLMADFRGKPLIQWVLDATAGLFPRRVVVTRHSAIAELCQSQGIACVLHKLPHRSDTIRLGMDYLGNDMSGCLFCPADQPLLQRATLSKMADAFLQESDQIWRTEYHGEVGSPVLFPQWAFPSLSALEEKRGGNAVIQAHRDKVRTVSVSDAWEMKDIDTQEDLERML